MPKSSIRNFEVAGEDQCATNEALRALNAQLQEALERQRIAANELRNIFYSTDIATLFLDREFKIRFFTPATRSLFDVMASDVGRALADVNSLAADAALLGEATEVLAALVPIDREIMSGTGVWYRRHIMPYRSEGGGVEGVVVTFIEVSERKHASDALEAEQRRAHAGDVSKRVATHAEAARHIAALTPREREVMDLVLAGHPNKNIAADLHISQRTVENHRAAVMKRTGAKSLPELARLAIAAIGSEA